MDPGESNLGVRHQRGHVVATIVVGEEEGWRAHRRQDRPDVRLVPDPIDHDRDVRRRGVPRESAHHGDELGRQIIPADLRLELGDRRPILLGAPELSRHLDASFHEVPIGPPGEVGRPRACGELGPPTPASGRALAGTRRTTRWALPHHRILRARAARFRRYPGSRPDRRPESQGSTVGRSGWKDPCLDDRAGSAGRTMRAVGGRRRWSVSHMSSTLPKIGSYCQTTSIGPSPTTW